MEKWGPISFIRDSLGLLVIFVMMVIFTIILICVEIFVRMWGAFRGSD